MPITSEYGVGPPVGVEPDQRLQQRRGQLQRQRDQPDLREAQRETMIFSSG